MNIREFLQTFNVTDDDFFLVEDHEEEDIIYLMYVVSHRIYVIPLPRKHPLIQSILQSLTPIVTMVTIENFTYEYQRYI